MIKIHEDPDGVAIHEAAHAVLAAKMGYSFVEVTIVEQDGLLAHISHVMERLRPSDDWHQVAKFLIAGTVAARGEFPAKDNGGGGDLEQLEIVAMMLGDLSVHEREWLANDWFVTTRQMVEAYREEILLVAKALLRRKTLTENDVFEMLGMSATSEEEDRYADLDMFISTLRHQMEQIEKYRHAGDFGRVACCASEVRRESERLKAEAVYQLKGARQ